MMPLMGGVRLSLIVVALAIAFPAAAEDKEAARKAYSEGSRYYNLNQYAEALEAFKRAYWNYEEPSFLYNIAQCHRALKHKSEAIDFYRGYLRNAPTTPKRAEVERLIAELDAALAQEKAVAKSPPEGTLPAPTATASPPTTSAPPDAVVTTTAPPAKTEKPLWKRGWLWGVVAGAAVVAAGVAIGVGVATSSPKDPSPSLGKATFN
jgi:tetratricopeptide (TPR) repeat protein